MTIKLQPKALTAFLLLLAIEMCIAKFVHDRFIRPFVGDIIVIWLLVYFLQSFLVIKRQYWLIVGVFLFACLVEIAQYFHLLELLHLQKNRLLTIVIGATFDWLDILAYTIGSMLLLILISQTGNLHD